jgi:hypothetical protein
MPLRGSLRNTQKGSGGKKVRNEFIDMIPSFFWPLILVCCVIGPFIGFFPTIIGRAKKNCRAIFALNLFLGWTFIGWVVALVWAFMEDSPEDEALARPLDVKPILIVFMVINLAGASVLYLAVQAQEAEQEAILAKTKEENQRRAAELENRRIEMEASKKRVDEARAEKERLQAVADFKAAPKWDAYGRPINRDLPQDLAPAELPSPTPAPTWGSIFPPGIDTPEQRREYLQALTEQKKKQKQLQRAQDGRY